MKQQSGGTQQIMSEDNSASPVHPLMKAARWNTKSMTDIEDQLTDIAQFRQFAARKIYNRGRAIKELQRTVEPLEDRLTTVLRENGDTANVHMNLVADGTSISPLPPSHRRSGEISAAYNAVDDNGKASTVCAAPERIMSVELQHVTEHLAAGLNIEGRCVHNVVTRDVEAGDIEKINRIIQHPKMKGVFSNVRREDTSRRIDSTNGT